MQQQTVLGAPSIDEVETTLSGMINRFKDLQMQPSPPRQHVDTGNNEELSSSVDALFSNIDMPLLQQPTPRHPRHRRVFDMTNVRRSARLTKRPAIPVIERAQRNLCHKLSILAEAEDPIKNVLRDFIATFQGPLLDHIITALSTLFELDDDGTDTLDNALLQHAGMAVADLAPTGEVVTDPRWFMSASRPLSIYVSQLRWILAPCWLRPSGAPVVVYFVAEPYCFKPCWL
jgi:hypothetical protein